MKALKLSFDGKGEVSMNLGGCWVNSLETQVAVLSGDRPALVGVKNFLRKHTEFVPYENMGSREDHYYDAREKLAAELDNVADDDLHGIIETVNNCPYLSLEISQ